MPHTKMPTNDQGCMQQHAFSAESPDTYMIVFRTLKLFDTFSETSMYIHADCKETGVSQYCVGCPACCSQQMGVLHREDLKGLFCVRHNACRVMHAFNCFMFTLHAQLYMLLPACLTSIGVRTTDGPMYVQELETRNLHHILYVLLA